MATLRMRVILIIFGLLFPLPHSFVIRKRSIGYDLIKDVKSVPAEEWLLERPDDTLLSPYAHRRYMDEDQGRLALDLLLQRPEDDYDLIDEDEELEEEPTFNGRDEASLLLPGEEDGDDVEEEEEELNEEAKLLNKSELENLFGKESELTKKTVIEEEPEKKDGALAAAKSELTKSDVEKLLNPSTSSSSKSELEKMVSETKILLSASNGSNSAPSYEGVRVVEVTEKDSDGGTRKQKQTQWLMSPDRKENDPETKNEIKPNLSIGRESWLGNVFSNAENLDDERRVKHKVKRSKLSIPEEVEDLDNDEIPPETDRDDVELLKTYIRLQTEENKHLEKALNLAITNQMENSDEYLDGEINQLRMAVKSEETLEAIRNAMRGRQNPQEGVEEDDNDEEEEDIGEDRELVDDDEVVGDEGDEEEEEDEFSRQLLKAKLKKFLIDSAVDELKENEDEKEEEQREEEESNEDHRLPPPVKILNPFTRNPFGDYVKMKRNKNFDGRVGSIDQEAALRASNEVDIADLLDTPVSPESGYCPAVRELADDCLAARREGLILDAEAVSLCNRHQICYSCGSLFGMTSETCDRGYLGESGLLCSGKEQCTREATGLYLIIARIHHFVPSYQADPFVCATECVYDYIVGEADY